MKQTPGQTSDPRLTSPAAPSNGNPTPTSTKIAVTSAATDSGTLDLVITLDASALPDLGGNKFYTIEAIIFGGTTSSAIFSNPRGRGSATVTIADVLGSTGLGNWEFYIIVRAGAGGDLGLIDPPIENDQEA